MLFERNELELDCFVLTSHEEKLCPHQPAPHYAVSGSRFEIKQPVLAEVALTHSKGQAAVTGREEPDSLESAKIVQTRRQGNIQGVKYKMKNLLLL